MEWFDRARVAVIKFTEIAVALLALGIVLQLLFGNANPYLGADIAGNIMKFLGSFGGDVVAFHHQHVGALDEEGVGDARAHAAAAQHADEGGKAGGY